MARILIVSANYAPDFHFGGVVRCVVDIAEALVFSGHSVSVITLSQDKEKFSSNSDCFQCAINGVNVIYLQGDKPFSLLCGLKKYISEHNWTFAYLPIAWQLIGVMASVILKKNRVPYVFSPHGSLSKKLFKSYQIHKTFFWHFALRHVVAGADSIVVNSAYERKTLIGATLSESEKLYIIPNIVKAPRSRLRSSDYGHLKILFWGRPDPKKRFEDVVLVVKALHQKGHKVKLDVYGDFSCKYGRRLQKYVERHDLGRHAKFYGHRPLTELPIQKFVNMLPSRDENFGLSVAELGYLGIPSIVSSNVGVSGYMNDGCLKANSIEEMVRLIENLLNDEVYAEYSMRVRENCEQAFDSSTIAADFLRVGTKGSN